MKSAVLLLILTLILAGGVCGYAAADEPIENVIDVTGPYAGITEELAAVSLSLNTTAKSMTAGTPDAASAEIQTIAAELDAAQLALSETSLASADVQDLIRIKNRLETAGSDLLYEDADKTAVVSIMQTAQTDLAAVKNHLTSTLAWAKNDPESFSSDATILERGLTDLANISASLETATIFLAAGTPDISVTLDQLQTEIGELILIRDELILYAVPFTITDDLAGIIVNLQTSTDALENGGDPFAVSAEITSSATALHTLNSQIAVLPAPETTIPTGTPTETATTTETVSTATPVQPTETAVVPTPEVIIPTGTQAPEGDNGAGMIILAVVIICAAGIVAAVFIIKKRSSRGKSAGGTNDPLNSALSGPADQVPQTHPKEEEEFVEIPAFQKEPETMPEKPVPAPEPIRSLEQLVTSAEPEKPVTLPSNAGPAEQFKLIASAIAKNRGLLQKSEALSPRDLIDRKNPNPLLLEYIALYEKVRYSPRSTPEDTTRLTELATRILKENA